MGALPSKDDCTPKVPQRLLNMDPRSPTEGIERTPIMVDATPIQIRELNIEDDPVRPNNLFDPRSPQDSSRTPLMTPIKFDFSELEHALRQHEKSQALLDVAPEKVITDEVATPPTTPLKSKDRGPIPKCEIPSDENSPLPKSIDTTPVEVKKKATPLSIRSPNVLLDSHSHGKKSLQKDFQTPTGGSRLRQVAHHNQAKKKTKNLQDENTPRAIRL